MFLLKDMLVNTDALNTQKKVGRDRKERGFLKEEYDGLQGL